jgi:hypothetical protein
LKKNRLMQFGCWAERRQLDRECTVGLTKNAFAVPNRTVPTTIIATHRQSSSKTRKIIPGVK